MLVQTRSLGLRLDHNQLDYILHPFTLFNKWAIFLGILSMMNSFLCSEILKAYETADPYKL